MSLSYRVSLQVCEVVSADDKTTHKLDLQSILPEDEMKGLLRDSLTARGFEEQEDGTLKRVEEGGEVITVNLEDLTMTTELASEDTVEGKVEGWGDAETRRGAQRDAERRAREQASALVDQGQREAQRRVTSQLAEGESARLEDMNQALQDVYAEALKRKARALGDVVEQVEGTNAQGEYELVIKVEL